jgi:hypothetical protein
MWLKIQYCQPDIKKQVRIALLKINKYRISDDVYYDDRNITIDCTLYDYVTSRARRIANH